MSARRGRPADGGPRVIVVGAGFAGLAAVKALDRADAQVMLVDRNIYSTFQPLLYQVATGGLNPGDVAFPLRVFASKHGARFRHSELQSIDAAGRRITLTDGAVLDYDYLVLGIGVSAAYYGVTGAALAELRALDDAFPEVDRADENIRLVEMAPALLAPFHPKLQANALTELRRRGVDVHLNTKIKEITEDRVILENGDELPSDVTVWAAGVSGPAGVSQWGLPQGHGGRIEVGHDLRVAGQDRIFAVGDIALIDDQPLSQVAQPAIQTGRHAGRQIVRLIAGRPAQPFRYHDKGIMATIGRRSAVVELPHGVRIHGTLAWLAWLGLHLFYLLGGRNRLSAMLNLSYRYLIWGHGGGVIVGDDPPAALPGGPAQLVPGAAAGSRQPPP